MVLKKKINKLSKTKNKIFCYCKQKLLIHRLQIIVICQRTCKLNWNHLVCTCLAMKNIQNICKNCINKDCMIGMKMNGKIEKIYLLIMLQVNSWVHFKNWGLSRKKKVKRKDFIRILLRQLTNMILLWISWKTLDQMLFDKSN